MTTATEEHVSLKTGAQFKESLRDGREVYYRGERIDVTTHAATAGGIDILARLYDAQHDPEARDVMTYVNDDGVRVSAAYLVPRTKEDLRFRREGIEYASRLTFGAFGRNIDMVSTLAVGMIAQYPAFERACPEYAANIGAFHRRAELENVHLTESIIEPQGYRARASGTSDTTPPPERGVARIVKESNEGVWISGVKAVGTATPQANEVMLGSFHPPLLDESFWVVVPLNSPGLRMVCREIVHQPGSSAYDHPLDSRGEEMEAILICDEVFVPRDRILSLRAQEVHSVNFYNVWARHEHWYTFLRLMVKAELLAGLLQLVVDTLEVGEVPVVRQRVADVIEFAVILRGMAIAAEERAELSEGGVMTPDPVLVTAARSYGLAVLPLVMHTIEDLAGQGLLLRFSDADFELPAAFGQKLEWFFDTRGTSAKEKNAVMNLVWDVVSSAHAARVKGFEEQNALNVPFLKQRLYGEYDRHHLVDEVRHFIGLGRGPKRTYQREIVHAWVESKKRGR
jgi:4-hydroxyphenylacetate 3-monooxygenase